MVIRQHHCVVFSSWAKPLGLLLLSVILFGCEPASQQFMSRGIGSDLPISEANMESTHKLQRKYFNYLCQEAGLAGAAYGGPPGSCSLGATDAGTWTLIVQQGLNDIDRRCDAYLQWLDNRKRTKGPLISQIGAIGATTTGIMGVTGATAEALTIAALAFGLVTQSVENYNGLLLNIDSSTVNSVVLNARHTFRKNIQNKTFSTKPEAEYVLRSYLRLCLPFAIETNINDYSTFGSAGIQPTVDNTINRTPVAGTPLRPSPQPSTLIKNAMGDFESNISFSAGMGIQAALCIGQDGNFGADNSNTRSAIKKFQQATGASPTGIIDSSVQKTRLLSAPACNNSKSRNAYEKFRYYDANYNVVQDRLTGLKADLSEIYTVTANEQDVTTPEDIKKIIDNNLMESDGIGPNIRKIIVFLTSSNSTLLAGNVPKNGSVSPELEKALDDFAV